MKARADLPDEIQRIRLIAGIRGRRLGRVRSGIVRLAGSAGGASCGRTGLSREMRVHGRGRKFGGRLGARPVTGRGSQLWSVRLQDPRRYVRWRSDFGCISRRRHGADRSRWPGGSPGRRLQSRWSGRHRMRPRGMALGVRRLDRRRKDGDRRRRRRDRNSRLVRLRRPVRRGLGPLNRRGSGLGRTDRRGIRRSLRWRGWRRHGRTRRECYGSGLNRRRVRGSRGHGRLRGSRRLSRWSGRSRCRGRRGGGNVCRQWNRHRDWRRGNRRHQRRDGNPRGRDQRQMGSALRRPGLRRARGRFPRAQSQQVELLALQFGDQPVQHGQRLGDLRRRVRTEFVMLVRLELGGLVAENASDAFANL